MTSLELFATIFPIISEDVKRSFLEDNNTFGPLCDCLVKERLVFVPKKDMSLNEFNEFINEFVKFCNNEGINPHGGAIHFNPKGIINGKYFYI